MSDTTPGSELVLADTKLVGLPDRFQPKNLTELMSWAKLINSSGLAPKGMNDAGIILAVQMGAELNITPTQALQNIAIINGRPCIYGDLGKALFRRDSKNCIEFEERSPQEAFEKNEGWCRIVMKGEKPIIRTFTMENAIKAGLPQRGGADSPWNKYPGRMLMFRARWWAMRDADPGVFKGMGGREEVEDHVIDATGVRVNGEPIAPPSRRSAPVAQEIDAFVADVQPSKAGEAPGAKAAPVIDRSKLQKVMIVGATAHGGAKPYYRVQIQPSSGPALEPSTFHESIYKLAMELKGKFGLVLLKPNVSKKDGKTYLNVEHLEPDQAPTPAADEAAPPEPDEPGSTG